MFKKYLQNFYNGYNVQKALKVARKFTGFLFWFIVLSLLLAGDSLLLQKYPDNIRQYTHSIEFNYVDWTLRAIWEKLEDASVHVEDYLPEGTGPEVVREYLKTVSQIGQVKAQIAVVYANPDIQDKKQAARPFQTQLLKLEATRDLLAPLAESILQKQVSRELAVQNLSTLGQPIPPVLYHSTPLPVALIVSPRGKIQQDANISLYADMTADEMTALEDQIMKDLDASALVVPVGGVGTYPTMVMSTSNLPFLADTIAHEWTHNYLTLRPLGINYETTPELRTINETVASIAGGEIGGLVLQNYYPDFLPKEQETAPAAGAPAPKADLQTREVEPFNYNKEMHLTRVTVDDLLAAGRVSEAETYMEERRELFWKNGYPIRRLNQAYFAFYGAYADTPVGAAGKDPVGPVVRAFRAQCGTLSNFLEQISVVTSFDQLRRMVKNVPAE